MIHNIKYKYVAIHVFSKKDIINLAIHVAIAVHVHPKYIGTPSCERNCTGVLAKWYMITK